MTMNPVNQALQPQLIRRAARSAEIRLDWGYPLL